MTTEQLSCRIKSVEKLNDQINAFELQTIDSDFVDIEPGAHLDIILNDNLIRQYSIFRNSEDNKSCHIAVKREDEGRGGSLHMHGLSEGDLLTVSQPRNNFQLDSDLEHYTLIAGGIGVTPIFAMANKLKLSGKRFDVYYLIQSAKDAAFARLFETLDLGDNLHIHATDENGLIHFPSAFENLPDQSVIYTCGPEPMMQAVEQAANVKGIDVYLERFSALPIDTDQENENFQVEIRSTGAVYTIEEDESILDILLEEGVEVDFGCMEGVCGACMTDVLDGEIEHRDSILTEKEQAANSTMCVCVSRSLSPKLVLDL